MASSILYMSHLQLFTFIQVVRPPKNVSTVVTYPRPLQNKSPKIQSHIFSPQHFVCPQPALVGDLGRQLVMSPLPLIAHKELQHGIHIDKAVVDGDEVHPRREARIVPLAVDGGLDGDAGAAQEGAEAAAEAVAVDVGQVLERVLLRHRHALAHLEERVGVRAQVVGFLAREAPQVREGGVRQALDPLR